MKTKVKILRGLNTVCRITAAGAGLIFISGTSVYIGNKIDFENNPSFKNAMETGALFIGGLGLILGGLMIDNKIQPSVEKFITGVESK